MDTAPAPSASALALPAALPEIAPEALLAMAKPPRLQSLDAMRGITIFLMLLVNNMALDTATPKQLMHAAWAAPLTVADLVYPWFLFCVGVAIPFAHAAFARKGLPSWRYDLRVLQRTGLLFILGLVVESSIARTPVFSLGVLQMIALAYLGGAVVYELPWTRRAAIAIALLTAYWAALKYMPVPGIGAGGVTETRNLIFYLNANFFGPLRVWGLPSALPTSCLVVIGSLVGDLLRMDLETRQKLLYLVGVAAALWLGSLAWERSLFMNKPLWTPSYILYTAGLGTALLTALHVLMDMGGVKRWAYPFLVYGSNAIVAYVMPILVKTTILQNWHVGKAVAGKAAPTVEAWAMAGLNEHLGRVPGGWAYTFLYLGVWWAVLWQLYRRRIFIKV